MSVLNDPVPMTMAIITWHAAWLGSVPEVGSGVRWLGKYPMVGLTHPKPHTAKIHLPKSSTQLSDPFSGKENIIYTQTWPFMQAKFQFFTSLYLYTKAPNSNLHWGSDSPWLKWDISEWMNWIQVSFVPPNCIMSVMWKYITSDSIQVCCWECVCLPTESNTSINELTTLNKLASTQE